MLALGFALLLAGTEPASASSHFTDYDTDDDGLIEIDSLTKLDAIRYDLDGDGVTTATEYGTAFPNRKAAAPNAMGCPASGCAGYELTANLDFDTDKDGSTYTIDNMGNVAADPDDAWHNGGAGWAPLRGTGAVNSFLGTFRGNGHTIANLYINDNDNTALAWTGLFGRIYGGHISGVGLPNASVSTGRENILVGTLAARLQAGSTVTGSWATGRVRATNASGNDQALGGLVGYASNSNTAVRASWAGVSVATAATAIDVDAGGLVGGLGDSATITASYATGAVSGGQGSDCCIDSYNGGLVGNADSAGAITASYATGAVTAGARATTGGLRGRATTSAPPSDVYWDTTTSGIDDDEDADPPEGKTTRELQEPIGYTGIYANWNVDVDNADGDNDITTGVDDPWDFGTASQYPALKGPVVARGDDLTVFSGAEVSLKASLVRDIRGNLTQVSDAGVAYAWRQVGGDAVMLSAADAAEPTFTAPTGLAEATVLIFAVTITLDPADPDSVVLNDLVRVTVNPAQPNELISLSVNAGGNERPLTPPFASSRRSFDTYVGAYTGRAEIALTAADDAATISFNGDDPVAATRTETVSLAEGHNRFTITVHPPPAEGDDAAADDAEPLEPVTYHLNIRRQRTPKLAFDPPRYLLMNEGETTTYTVELDTRWLGAEVIINISSDNPDITVSPDTVSISQYDWSERTIEVTAAKDADGEDDYATIRHIANGGHYNNVGGRLRVEVSDDDIVPTPTPAPTPTPTPAPTPTPTPGPTPPPVASSDRTTELVLDGRTVTITREAGALLGASVSLPSRLTRDLTITYAPMIPGLPLSSARYGLGATPEAQSGVTLTVVGVPAGGLELCLPVPSALASEAGARPLTLVRYEGAGWNGLPGAVHRATEVCAGGISSGVFAAAYTIPQLGPASNLTVAPGDVPGTIVLRWTPGNDATRHWVAGIKQSDLDAGDMSSSLIWTAASGTDTHTLSGLESGVEYVFAVAAGRGSEWSGWTGLARGTAE